MKFFKAISSAWISSTSPKPFSLQKYNKDIFDLLKCTSMDFFRLFGFSQESHWILYLFLKKILYIQFINIATNFSCCFLEELNLEHSRHLKIYSLVFEKNLTIWLLTLWETLYSNHKSECWIPQHTFMLYISKKFCRVYTKYRFHRNVLYLQDILPTCNIWKHLCWGHNLNLVASFRQQRQKTFVMLSGFLSLRGFGDGGLSESIKWKICDENVAVAIL